MNNKVRQKNMKKIILLLLMSLLMTGCVNDNPISYVENQLGVKLNNAKVEKNKEKEDSFLGDGTAYTIIKNINRKFEKQVKNRKDWSRKPTKLERLLLYGYKYRIEKGPNIEPFEEEMEEEPYVTDDKEKRIVPKMDNAYYYFKDTEWFENEKEKEKERRLDPVPRNFIIAVYDVDNNRLYYYEYDS